MRVLCGLLAFAGVASAQEAPVVVVPVPVCLPPAICVLPVEPPAAPGEPAIAAPAPLPYPPEPVVVPPAPIAPPPAALTTPPRSNFVLVERTRPRLSVLGTGIAVFLVSWAIPAIVGAEVGYSNLAIPFAGPILAMKDCGSGFGCPVADEYLAILLAHQFIGAIAAIVGAATKEKVGRWVPRVTPVASRAMTGFVLTARF